MDSDILDLAPLRIRGRSSKTITAEVVRELTPSDLAKLEESRDSKAPALKRFRDSHHRVARCFASGMTPSQVSAQTGYSHSRLSILQDDPSFQDLISIYRKAGEETFAQYQDVALGNLLRGERLIEESLEAAAESETPLSLGELRPVLDIVSDRADRLGYPKHTASTTINLDFAGRLESARRRSGLALPSPPADASPDKEPVAE